MLVAELSVLHLLQTTMHDLQAQKALIESMIAEDDKIEGLEHVECKVFK